MPIHWRINKFCLLRFTWNYLKRVTLLEFLVVTISWFRRAFEHSYGKHDYFIYWTSILAKNTPFVNVSHWFISEMWYFYQEKYLIKQWVLVFILGTNLRGKNRGILSPMGDDPVNLWLFSIRRINSIFELFLNFLGGFWRGLGFQLFFCFVSIWSKSYETFLIASFMTSRDAPPLYKPYVILGFSCPTMSAARFSPTPAFSNRVVKVFLIEWKTYLDENLCLVFSLPNLESLPIS